MPKSVLIAEIYVPKSVWEDAGNAIKDMGVLSDAPAKVGRASPMEHEVSDYFRIQNGKKVHVPKYKRGGKKNA